MSLTLEAHPDGFFRMSYPLLEKAARRQVRKELEILKDMLEARASLP